MKNIFLYIFVVGLSLLVSCENVNKNWKADSNDPEMLHRSLKKYTDIIVHDIFSPPVASRNYAYPTIAAYEIMALNDPKYKSLAGQLNGFSSIPTPKVGVTINHPIAAISAFMKTGANFIFSEGELMAFYETLKEEWKAIHMPSEVYDASILYGEKVADHILAWADKDNYKESRSFPKFSVKNDPGRWRPTPPGYMDGIEPAWNTIRPFVIDSASQFQPPFPTAYSTDPNSPFYKEVIEVYDAVKNAGEEEKEIASFWDCNPYVLNVTGHVMHATKKITPGGHWMGIAAIASRETDADFMKSAHAYALTAIALADGFISCWDEKYRSNLTRPETVINENLDEDWVPLLQTPPFPEYTSGHSVISSAAAIALTSIFGENFAFADDTEVEFGLPVRRFNSFIEASEEAAVSRLYGGIHYRPAIDNGVTQGRKLGRFIIQELDMLGS